MSTRYVWEKYDAKFERKETVQDRFILDGITSSQQYLITGEGYTAYGIDINLTNINPQKLDFKSIGENPAVKLSTGLPASKWKTAKLDRVANIVYEAINAKATDRWWVDFYSPYYRIYIGGTDPDSEPSAEIRSTHILSSIGDYIGKVSSASKYDYPTDSTFGNYWYKYKGYDDVDPSAISYSIQDLYGGEPVTVSVTPVTPTYGGTVYYQYQYSTDGGSTWTNIGSKTTATSKTITIPEGAEQFQARVLASDGWGFTSATYVNGANLPVSQIKAYATVDGKLMAGAKMYATVGGKIRQIQKGYATVGGKIRKMF